MLYVTNNEGIIKFFNPEAEKITGYESVEIINKLTPVIFHQEKDIQICKEQLQKELGHTIENAFDVLKLKSERKEMLNHECIYKTKNGGMINVVLTLTPIHNKAEQISGYLGVAMDITKRKEAEADLVKALGKEKKLGELKSRFVSMASHEFRTPLSTILSSAFLVEKYTTEEQQSKREKHLDRIVSSVNNLTNILNEFLSVGKIEEGKIGLTLTDFNIKTLIQTIIQEMSQSLKKGQQIKYEHSGDEWVVLDISILKNILMNLISNAIKFSLEDSIIEVSTLTDESTIKLEVKDHGIGIPDQDKDHLMERFFRANNANTIQGTGLGLYIVSKYAERMNGKITYSSEENKGTTFNIIFSKQKPQSHEINTVN
jgi:PAS domain S-box-containing protein